MELLQGEFEVELAGHRDLANGCLRDGSAETYFLAETEVCRPYNSLPAMYTTNILDISPVDPLVNMFDLVTIIYDFRLIM